MLNFTTYFLFEAESFTDCIVEKTYDLSDTDKKDLENLINKFHDTQEKIDKEYTSLFTYGLYPGPIERKLDYWIKKKILLYILRKENKIIGFSIISPNHRMFKDVAYINYFMIDENYRSKGYGYFFLKKIIQDLKKTYPNKHITINTYAKNEHAKKLYQKVGFKITSHTLLIY